MIVDKIKKYGVLKSLTILLKKILFIDIQKFHYLKLKLEDVDFNSMPNPQFEIKELVYEDFLKADKAILTRAKLQSVEKRLNDGNHIAYGIFENSKLVYSTWIAFNEMSLPISKSYPLKEYQGYLEDSYCSIEARGKGYHSIMNMFRIKEIFSRNKTEIIAIVLDGNVPAMKTQLKSGFKNLGYFYCGKVLGFEVSTLKKEQYDCI